MYKLKIALIINITNMNYKKYLNTTKTYARKKKSNISVSGNKNELQFQKSMGIMYLCSVIGLYHTNFEAENKICVQQFTRRKG